MFTVAYVSACHVDSLAEKTEMMCLFAARMAAACAKPHVHTVVRSFPSGSIQSTVGSVNTNPRALIGKERMVKHGIYLYNVQGRQELSMGLVWTMIQ